ncbi:MAG TPA: AlkA N-terminal domain-containing protein [Polyangiaceae bacterium]|jgi:AraC family transcriptional regulator of adaptative response / DNA-3-methyladenine glycosylase II
MDLDHDACYRALRQRDSRFDGRFFTAVKTTGIYCRPVCPARTPRSQNVIFYPTAAAAQEAGFRPCLRCRPETAPDLGAWRGTSNTVARALALIELGALDRGNVDALAERLGIGERQLRRVFQEHLGASPIGVAQTRRVLLAKQLIHETRLPMAEIAFASGFGSVRRFNEAFTGLFGRAPSQLRRLGGADVSLATSGELLLSLRYQPPYDWPKMLEFLEQRAIAGLERVNQDGYARAIWLDGVAGTISVRPGDGNTLRAGIRVPKLAVVPGVIARLRRMFDLAADPLAIAEHLAKDPVLAPLVKKRPGLRVPGAWDGFELSIRAVLGQQITVIAAARLAAKLVARYGEPIAAPLPGISQLFPKPEALAHADLSTLGMPKSRAATLSAVAAAALENPELFGGSSSLEQAVERLRAIRGVGEWTAEYIALRQLREPDAFPASDLGVLRALCDEHGKRPNASEVLARAENWRPWRAYAAQHLWAA